MISLALYCKIKDCDCVIVTSPWCGALSSVLLGAGVTSDVHTVEIW